MWKALTNAVERVRARLFGKSAFNKSQMASTFVTDEMASAIDRWALLYRNKAPWLARNSSGLSLPSSIAREVATLVTLEMQVAITDTTQMPNMSTTRAGFIANVFRMLAPQYKTQVEYACALGGLVFKPYVDGNNIAIDFVQADDFYPVSFSSRGEITSAIFIERKREGRAFYTRVERHDINDTGYTISNHAFSSYADNDIGTEIPLTDIDEWKDLQPITPIENVDFPLFAYFRIPQGNVVDKHSLLGVSVYARADSAGLIEEADKQWQRLMWEFEGGEMAIESPADAFRHVRNKSGESVPALPVGKERLYRLNNLDIQGSTNELMKTFAPQLRDTSFINGLNTTLMRIEDVTGLARGTYSDINEQSKTATELKISRQRSYATVTAIQRSLESALDSLAKAIDALASLYNLAPEGDYQISYVWDDSIIVDADTEREKDRQDVHDGLMLPWEYRVKWYGETDEQAKTILAQAKSQTNDEIFGFQQHAKHEYSIIDEE